MDNKVRVLVDNNGKVIAYRADHEDFAKYVPYAPRVNENMEIDEDGEWFSAEDIEFLDEREKNAINDSISSIFIHYQETGEGPNALSHAMWPHFKNHRQKDSPPLRYFFIPPKALERCYNAVSFANYNGIVLNSFITINWSLCFTPDSFKHITDSFEREEVLCRWGKLNHDRIAQSFTKLVHNVFEKIPNHKLWMLYVHEPYPYMVMENKVIIPYIPLPHTHILMNLPDKIKINQLKERVYRFLRKEFCIDPIPSETVDIQTIPFIPPVIDLLPDIPNPLKKAIDRQWHWFAYMCKYAFPESEYVIHGDSYKLYEVYGLRQPKPPINTINPLPNPVLCKLRLGTTRNMDIKTMKKRRVSSFFQALPLKDLSPKGLYTTKWYDLYMTRIFNYANDQLFKAY